MWSSSPRDNWARLVEAVVKREQIRQLCRQDSITTAASSSFRSEEVLSFSSSRSERISVSPPRRRPLTTASSTEFRKNASTTSIWKLFSALPWRTKLKDNNLDGIPDSRLKITVATSNVIIPNRLSIINGTIPYVHKENIHEIKKMDLIEKSMSLGEEVRARRFSLPELQFATDNFHNKNILGRGSHGYLYKGRLEDGSLVAVKRLTDDLQEFVTELDVTSIVVHRNVLHARGFCFTEKEWLIVFPFMPNGSVASLLRVRFVSKFNWAIRYRIAIKVARGLCYLHHDCPRPIIHSDIKAANILLDEDFEAFISGFRVAKFVDCNDEYDAIRGTIGHIVPEYYISRKCSLKSDVYGYGVFLLELITGQGVSDNGRLANNDDLVVFLDWVKQLYEENNLETMVDPDINVKFVEEEVEMLLLLALICTHDDPELRPMMLEVVKMLEYGDGLAVYKIYLANKLRKSSMQIMTVS